MLNNYLIWCEQQNVMPWCIGTNMKDFMTNFDLIGYFDTNFLTKMVFNMSKRFLIFEKNHLFWSFFWGKNNEKFKEFRPDQAGYNSDKVIVLKKIFKTIQS